MLQANNAQLKSQLEEITGTLITFQGKDPLVIHPQIVSPQVLEPSVITTVASVKTAKTSTK